MSIEIRRLNFSYGAKKVLRDVDLTIEEGRTLSILGPNGAGKTTLLNIVAGLLDPPYGSVLYDGIAPRNITPGRMALLVGYVPQNITPAFDYRVLDYVVTGAAPEIGFFQRPGKEHYGKAAQALADMGISHLAEESYKQLSGGERQMVSIARVLTQSPAYILMDEPAAHLDYGNQARVLGIIRRLSERGFGVVFTTHNPDQALLLGGGSALIGRNGNLVSGNADELINGDFLSELYGAPLRVTELFKGGRKICFIPALPAGESGRGTN